MTLNEHRKHLASHSVAVATGGGQGIGKVITARLVSDGMLMVIFDKDREAIVEIGGETLQRLPLLPRPGPHSWPESQGQLHQSGMNCRR